MGQQIVLPGVGEMRSGERRAVQREVHHLMVAREPAVAAAVVVADQTRMLEHAQVVLQADQRVHQTAFPSPKGRPRYLDDPT